jgi:2,4-dienoyl-CoA reductase-like NADH-dependent reductase (Old Yellow Enzyme family)/thioredoxin reductase
MLADRLATNDPLLQPFTIKNVTFKNRIISTAHEPQYASGGLPKDQYRLYHREKAKGGIALTMTAGSAVVSRDSPAVFGNVVAYDDSIIPWMRDLADSCHEFDCKVMIQITHLGRRTRFDGGDWLPVLAPSPMREPAHRAFPKTIETWDIDRIVSDYADAAERMKFAGLDGIEIELYGHLLDSFWSPATNHRDDEFGGSLDNRLRFTWKVLDAIRDRVGDDFLVGARMVADEDYEHGLTKSEGIEIARRLGDSGQIDFLNIVKGRIDTEARLSKVIPLGGTPAAPQLDLAGEVRAATRLPVFHAARIPDVATARYAIASGKLDMVGMTRAHIADPYIVKKIEAGEEHRIRPCVGAGYCIDRLYQGADTLCIHNASTSREAYMPHVITPKTNAKKNVLIVGAGPAGLEAARVAAERGHQVKIFEAASHAGGQIRLAAANPRRKEMIGIVDWRLAELERLGVDISFNVWVQAEDAVPNETDVVLLATGGIPKMPDFEAGEDLVTSSWDILSGSVKPAAKVLVFDDHGGHQGLSAAEVVANAGSELELVTPERYFAPDLGLEAQPYLEVLQRHNARITIANRVAAVHRMGNQLSVKIVSDHAPGWQDNRIVDQVIVEHGTEPLEDLYLALKPQSRNLGAVDYGRLTRGQDPALIANPEGKFTLFRIGDSVSSRNIHAAIYEGMRYMMAI